MAQFVGLGRLRHEWMTPYIMVIKEKQEQIGVLTVKRTRIAIVFMTRWCVVGAWHWRVSPELVSECCASDGYLYKVNICANNSLTRNSARQHNWTNTAPATDAAECWYVAGCTPLRTNVPTHVHWSSKLHYLYTFK